MFDTTDRVQHMFFAQKDGGGEHSRVIEDLYRRADELVGQTMALWTPTRRYSCSPITASLRSSAAWI